jgi:hypothetical protein
VFFIMVGYSFCNDFIFIFYAIILTLIFDVKHCNKWGILFKAAYYLCDSVKLLWVMIILF